MRIEKFTNLYRDVTKEGTKIPQEKYCLTGQFPIVDQGQRVIAGWWNDDAGIFKNVPAIIFGDHTRAIKYMEQPFFIGADGVKILRPTNIKDNPKYLYYALQAAKIPNLGYSRHFKVVKELQICIYSRDEQNEIVRVLEKIDYLIEQRHAETTYLDQLVKSRFIEMFGDPKRNPRKWDMVTIGDIATDVRYGTSRPATEGGKYPYLRMNNLTYEGYLDLTDLKHIDIPDNEVEKCVVRNGDVLFNRTNSVELVGKTCVYNLDSDMIIAGYIIRVRIDDRVLPVILSSYLNSTVMKEQLRSMAKGAVNQANINAQELRSIPIYLPPITLQHEFATFVEQVDKSKFYIVQMQILLRLLTRAIQQKTTEVLL